MSVCVEPGCPRLVRSGRCKQHARTSSRNHHGISRQARGYDALYQQQRATLLGEPCALRLSGCTGTATTAQHTDDGLLVPACAHCNYADGARRARHSPLEKFETASASGPHGSQVFLRTHRDTGT